MNTFTNRSLVSSSSVLRSGCLPSANGFALGKLAALVSGLATRGPDAQARELAADILHHFCGTAREHHEDEERHVFPQLLISDDAELVQAVQRLQQDHGWLAEDWMALSPHIDAVACGHAGYDLDVLREGAAVFTALYHDHIALEESIAYPQARARLHPSDKREMALEMAARRRSRLKLEKRRHRQPAGPAEGQLPGPHLAGGQPPADTGLVACRHDLRVRLLVDAVECLAASPLERARGTAGDERCCTRVRATGCRARPVRARALTGQRSASIGAGVKDNRRIARTLLRLAAGPGSDRVSVAELLRAFGPHAPAVLTLLFAERAADATGHIGDPRYPVAVHDGAARAGHAALGPARDR